MREVFFDKSLEKSFQENGYVQIPFLNQSEVELLKNNFFALVKESGGINVPGEFLGNPDYEVTYDFTFIDKNIQYKKDTFKAINAVFEPIYSKILNNYKPIIGNFIRKQHQKGEVPLHQNWAFADEMKCSTVSIWVPLVNSTVNNGTLQVVPKSHKKFGKHRGPMVPWELENIKTQIIQNHLIPLETKAGDCVILDDSIVHYSAPNQTNDLRLTIQLILIPEELPSIHYHMNPAKATDKIEVLEVDHEFYMQFNPWKLPENEKSIRTIPFKFQELNEQQFVEALKKPRFDQTSSNSLIKRLMLKLKVA